MFVAEHLCIESYHCIQLNCKLRIWDSDGKENIRGSLQKKIQKI